MSKKKISGATFAEYVLLVGLIGVAVFVGMSVFGSGSDHKSSGVTASITNS